MNSTPINPILQRAKSIKLFAFDVDGVLTDGRLYFTQEGERIKVFNATDGLGIKWLQSIGIKTGVITARRSKMLEKRVQELGIDYLIQGQENKAHGIQELVQKSHYQPKQFAYMGDDLPDLGALQTVGLAMTVVNAPAIIQKHAHWISKKTGGDGAVREACEYILQAQEQLESIYQRYYIP